MKKIIKPTFITVAILIGFASIMYFDHFQSYPGKYSFKEINTGEIVEFEIGMFPYGWNKKYKLLGSHTTKELLEMQKPQDLPEYLVWDNYNKEAYFSGRIFFAKDSSFALIAGERPRAAEEGKNMSILSLKKTVHKR